MSLFSGFMVRLFSIYTFFAFDANRRVDTVSPKFRTAGDIQKTMAKFEFFVNELSRSLVNLESL